MIESSLPQSEPVLLPGRPFGRQVRSVIGYSLLTALMIITPMLVFVPAALLHCAIRNGRRAAWVVLVLSLAIAALFYAAPAAAADAQKMTWSYLAGVALAITLPAMAAIPMVKRGESFGRVIVFLLAGSIAGLAVTEAASRALLSFSPYATQVAQWNEASAQVMQFYRSKGMPADMLQFTQQWSGYTTFVLPAMILIQVSLVFVLSLLMLGRLKAWREAAAQQNDGTALDAYLFRNFSLPDGLLFAFILGGLTPLLTGVLQKVAANTLTIVVFLYILQGLAIFRFMLTAMGVGVVGTLVGWMLLGFLTITGIGPLLLGVTGLFDSFFDFRHFKKRKDDSNESHSD